MANLTLKKNQIQNQVQFHNTSAGVYISIGILLLLINTKDSKGFYAQVKGE
jgi:hypothetical protein